MIITSDKAHTETYRDMLKQFSGSMEPSPEAATEESAQAINSASNSHAVPEPDIPEIESFGLRLTSMLTGWLRKHAD